MASVDAAVKAIYTNVLGSQSFSQMPFSCYCCGTAVESSPQTHLVQCIKVQPGQDQPREDQSKPQSKAQVEFKESLTSSIDGYSDFLRTVPIYAEDTRTPLSRPDQLRYTVLIIAMLSGKQKQMLDFSSQSWFSAD